MEGLVGGLFDNITECDIELVFERHKIRPGTRRVEVMIRVLNRLAALLEPLLNILAIRTTGSSSNRIEHCDGPTSHLTDCAGQWRNLHSVILSEVRCGRARLVKGLAGRARHV